MPHNSLNQFPLVLEKRPVVALLGDVLRASQVNVNGITLTLNVLRRPQQSLGVITTKLKAPRGNLLTSSLFSLKQNESEPEQRVACLLGMWRTLSDDTSRLPQSCQSGTLGCKQGVHCGDGSATATAALMRPPWVPQHASPRRTPCARTHTHATWWQQLQTHFQPFAKKKNLNRRSDATCLFLFSTTSYYHFFSSCPLQQNNTL